MVSELNPSNMTIPETRSKVKEETVKKIENQLQSYIESNDSKMEELGRKLDLLMEKMVHHHDEILGSAPRDGLQLDNSTSQPYKGEYNEQGRSQRSNHYAKYVFPYFDGDDPCSWLRKGESYFHYHRISDPEEKLEVAALHLTSKAESWFFSYQINQGTIKWHAFTEEICKRFKGANNSKFNLMGEFENIEHKGSIVEYLNKFEDLKA